MKKQFTIYSDLKVSNVYHQLFSNYDLNLCEIKDINKLTDDNDGGLILIPKLKENIFQKLKTLNQSFIILTHSLEKISDRKNIMILKAPVSVESIQNSIKKFLIGKITSFEDLSIFDNKLINVTNKKFCSLTDIEKEILIYLISDNNCTKEYIKKNILNIKITIETNSIDSHLTRIRKKFDSINTACKIQTRNESLKIFIDQKNLD